jgi:hypothetical protein
VQEDSAKVGVVLDNEKHPVSWLNPLPVVLDLVGRSGIGD